MIFRSIVDGDTRFWRQREKGFISMDWFALMEAFK